jgi:quercetin dioxygenase-like cupin family protein
MGTPKIQPQAGDDPVRVDSKHYQVEFEDERIRVVRVRYGPREKSVMHGHPSLVGVCLTDQHSRFTYPDGRSEEVRAKAGQVLHFNAFQHLPENLSDQPMELVLIELKQ